MSEKTGRSYRRINSRNAVSRPCWASATTSASGRLRRSRAGGIAGPSQSTRAGCAIPAAYLACAQRHGHLSTMPVTELETAEAQSAAAGGDEKRAYVQR